MGNLSFIGSKTINGVAFLHSELLKTTIFKAFYKYQPKKFFNMTNGVTTRRWLLNCNPKLAALLTDIVGDDDWVLNMETLKSYKKIADDPKVQKQFLQIKQENKEKLMWWIKQNCGT